MVKLEDLGVVSTGRAGHDVDRVWEQLVVRVQKSDPRSVRRIHPGVARSAHSGASFVYQEGKPLVVLSVLPGDRLAVVGASIVHEDEAGLALLRA